MNRTQRLEAIYARIPKIDCKKKCQGACGPIGLTQFELHRLGVKSLVVNPRGTCPLLTPDGACSRYDVRPTICRLWGISDGMPCPYGCKPERVLTELEAFTLMHEVRELSPKIIYSDMSLMNEPINVTGRLVVPEWLQRA